MVETVSKITKEDGSVVDPHSFIAVPDPDQAFYLNADPDPDPGSQTIEDPSRFGSGSWSDFI
jgi:hypothetical protein